MRKTSSGRRSPITRRKFLRDLTVVSLTALGGSAVLEGCALSPAPTETPSLPLPTYPNLIVCIPTPTVPATPGTTDALPVSSQAMSVMEALRNRKSASTFQSQPIPRDKLLELLWAAWGINRPDSGKRTAPSAMNAQEIDIYVLLADGAFVYNAKTSLLAPVVEQDIRSQATTSGSLKDAPIQLVYVADYSKLRTSSQSQRDMWSAAHTGFIGQNVYLYCASQGLGARFYAGINAAALKTSLKLRDDQSILFGQAVGYPKT